jgi:hypothetical protein
MPNRIQVNIQSTPTSTSKNGRIAQYLKRRFNGAYSAAYLIAAEAFWYHIMLSEAGASEEEIEAAKEKSELLRQRYERDEGAGPGGMTWVDSVDSFEDLEDDDE